MRHRHPFAVPSSAVVQCFVSHFASTSHLHVALHLPICLVIRKEKDFLIDSGAATSSCKGLTPNNWLLCLGTMDTPRKRPHCKSNFCTEHPVLTTFLVHSEPFQQVLVRDLIRPASNPRQLNQLVEVHIEAPINNMGAPSPPRDRA